jgi:1-acyl-sn-glycerol-3-phosphate acyltransferase|tara:strand:+ start:55 stop:807 length:753 start_codon:yes stop_codon:yes gene_type:complete
MTRVRAFFLVLITGIFVFSHELIQRTLLPLVLRCFPGKREYILTKWCQWIAGTFVNIARVTGVGDFPIQPVIEADSKVLILMNHQSLLDIPLAIKCIRDGYPLIVTHQKHEKGVPLISNFLDLYDFPTVSSRGGRTAGLKKLIKAADGPNPVVIYPEGTRSWDGELLPFRTGALRVLLDGRQWKVYLLVADGAWPYTTFNHIASLKGKIEWKMKLLGPFDSPERIENLPSWTADMEDRMRKGLALLREES